LTGGLEFEGKYYQALSCVYATPGTTNERLMGGRDGAVVAFLSYPRLDTERGLPAREALAAAR
jgi:hypothetical protein